MRALRGPGPFLGSNAIAVSPDGRNVYVASSRSDAIAVFIRDRRNGALSQSRGSAGCIAAGGDQGCAEGVGLRVPNSVAVSPDGRNVYATSGASNAVVVFQRDRSTGALTQASDGSGCIASPPTAGCSTGRALGGPDVVVVSPDGGNVYVGAFFGNAIAVFDRNRSTGVLTQPAGVRGCVTNAPTPDCATGLALQAPEGMGISADGKNLYVATAISNALLNLVRERSTGALSQAVDGSGCITDAPTDGCTTGVQIAGANAVGISPDDADVYITTLFSNSVSAFARDQTSGQLDQLSGTSACAIYVIAVGCGLARELSAPEGVAVSPDGASVYAAAYGSSAIDVFNRDPGTGAVVQKAGRAGCLTHAKTVGCARGRRLRRVTSLALSPDGRNLYSAAFGSNAVAVFNRVGTAR